MKHMQEALHQYQQQLYPSLKTANQQSTHCVNTQIQEVVRAIHIMQTSPCCKFNFKRFTSVFLHSADQSSKLKSLIYQRC